MTSLCKSTIVPARPSNAKMTQCWRRNFIVVPIVWFGESRYLAGRTNLSQSPDMRPRRVVLLATPDTPGDQLEVVDSGAPFCDTALARPATPRRSPRSGRQQRHDTFARP